jgi:histidine ammonia-lyase
VAKALSEKPPVDLELDGATLLPEKLILAAKHGAAVTVPEHAWQRVRDANTILLKAAAQDQKIYGLTTGVGANKDQSELSGRSLFTPDGRIAEEAMITSRHFNHALLHAHSAGVGPNMPAEIVRTVLIIRLNTALTGGSGMNETLVRGYMDFLNHDILPVIPGRGTVGEADITLLAHIGLAMTGQWKVLYQGVEMPAAEALEKAGLAPLDPFGKDALASFSSNAYSATLACFALVEMQQIARCARVIYSLSLEALNGNLAPIMPEPSIMRPFPAIAKVAADLRGILKGSYLHQHSDTRPLQDPLSFRTAIHQIGGLDRALEELRELLEIQINGADDNPVVFVGKIDPETAAQPGIMPVKEDGLEGAVIPSANFSPLPYVLSMERVAIAGAHLSKGSLERTLRLSDPHFTGLKRFLGTDRTIHAFGAIQKPIVGLDAENQELAEPISLTFAPVAIDVEDMGTNSARVGRRLRTLASNLQNILGFELMHAAQAIDLRLASDPDLPLSKPTRALHEAYRQVVPFLETDAHVLTVHISESGDFVNGYFDEP